MAKVKKSKFPVLAFAKDKKGTVIRAEFSEFKGKHLINIRDWYLDSDDELQPGKGFTVPADKAAAFLLELQAWAGEMLDALPEEEEAAPEIEVGMKVKFEDEDEGEVVGEVIKLKGKTATVEDDVGDEYKVKIAELVIVPKKKKKKEEKPAKKSGKKSKKSDDDLVDMDDDEDEDEAPKKKSKKDGKKKKRKASSL